MHGDVDVVETVERDDQIDVHVDEFVYEHAKFLAGDGGDDAGVDELGGVAVFGEDAGEFADDGRLVGGTEPDDRAAQHGDAECALGLGAQHW